MTVTHVVLYWPDDGSGFAEALCGARASRLSVSNDTAHVTCHVCMNRLMGKRARLMSPDTIQVDIEWRPLS